MNLWLFPREELEASRWVAEEGLLGRIIVNINSIGSLKKYQPIRMIKGAKP